MRIGILGGGQLGALLAEQALRLGAAVQVVDPQVDCPAAAVAPVLAAPFDAPETTRALEWCDAVTYEFEGVPLDVCQRLETRVPLFPGTAALEVVRDRFVEKRFLRAQGIPTAEFRPVSSPHELDSALDALGFPAVLKTRADGYDGKGQWLLSSRDDVPDALRQLGSRPAILEAFVPFDRELSLIGVCDADGELRTWAPTENAHVGGILRVSRSPARGLGASQLDTGRRWLGRICDTTDYRGVIAVELFEVQGRWLVNEIACRVHNSGHWTLDGAETSQFENHVRAVLGLPLGDTASRGSSAMVNLIGAVPSEAAVSAVSDARVYLYGKTPRPRRKLGHINLLRGDDEARDRSLRTLIDALGDREMSRAHASIARFDELSADAAGPASAGPDCEHPSPTI